MRHAPHTMHRSHRKKRMNQIKKMMQRGLLDPEKEDPFSLFVASTNIRWVGRQAGLKLKLRLCGPVLHVRDVGAVVAVEAGALPC